MPYDLTFSGNFFHIADFISGIDSLVSQRRHGRGRRPPGDSQWVRAKRRDRPGLPRPQRHLLGDHLPDAPLQGITAGATMTNRRPPPASNNAHLRRRDQRILNPDVNNVSAHDEHARERPRDQAFGVEGPPRFSTSTTICGNVTYCPSPVLVVAIVAVPIARSQSSELRESPELAAARCPRPSRDRPRNPGELSSPRPPRAARLPPPAQLPAREGPLQAAVHRTGRLGIHRRSGPGGESEGWVKRRRNGSPSTRSNGPNPWPGGGEATHGGLRYYSYAIDVRLLHRLPVGLGAQRQRLADAKGPNAPRSTWITRHNLPELTMLPEPNVPAVIFMGSTKDGKKALMLVSSNVTRSSATPPVRSVPKPASCWRWNRACPRPSSTAPPARPTRSNC